MEMKFCPFCGNEINPNAKFCGKCGQSINQTQTNNTVENDSPSQQIPQNNESIPVQPQAAKKDFVANNLNTAKESAQKATEKLKQAAADSQVTSKIQNSIDSLNKQPEKKAKLKKIAAVILAILVIGFGWNWVSGKDYRKAIATGDSYFERGEFGKSVEFYEKAHDEKPNSKKANEMLDYSKDLSDYWVRINDDDYGEPVLNVVEELEQKASDIKDKKIKTKYTEAIDRIKKTNRYQIEKQTMDNLTR